MCVQLRAMHEWIDDARAALKGHKSNTHMCGACIYFYDII